MAYEVLTFEERIKLPMILEKRKLFRDMMEAYITSYHLSFTNNMVIYGKAGSGKTTLVIDNLDKLKQAGLIEDYYRVSGHVTPSSLMNLLYKTASREAGAPPKILVLDDVDCLADEGCLELLKSAFDTKSDIPTNREVSYLNQRFKYKGYGIIITNENMVNSNDVHQKAILDRAQVMSIDLDLNDMIIYTTSLVEDYINTNPDKLSDDELNSIVELFNTEIREWIELGVFQKSRISYSIRLIKKFVENQRMFKTKWKAYSTIYQNLVHVADTARKEKEIEDMLAVQKEQRAQEIIANSKVSEIGAKIVTKLTDLKIVNPRSGAYYSVPNLSYLKKTGRLVLKNDKHWYLDDEMVG